MDLVADASPEAVITGLDVDDIYEIPLIFEKEGLAEIIHKKLTIYIHLMTPMTTFHIFSEKDSLFTIISTGHLELSQ